eukprot:3866096-Pleurochrysis_carterae.AAC.1
MTADITRCVVSLQLLTPGRSRTAKAAASAARGSNRLLLPGCKGICTDVRDELGVESFEAAL